MVKPSEHFGRGPYNFRYRDSERLQRVHKLANLLDSYFVIPGTGIRFGWDNIIGLIPGVGDLTTLIFSLLIIHAALEAKAPASIIARMVGNVAIDTILGSVPVVGDIFDVAWKSNRRNADLLSQFAEAPTRVRSRSRIWIVAFVALVGFAMVGFTFVVVKLVVWAMQARH